MVKIKYLIFMLPFVVSAVFGCAKKTHIQKTVATDTIRMAEFRKIDYSTVAHLNLKVGGKMSLPEVGFTITRISDSEALIEQKKETIKETIKEIEFVSTKTKTIDKRIIDSNVKSKIKDKETTRIKEKPNNKQVTRGFPWVILLLAALALLIVRMVVKRTKLW